MAAVTKIRAPDANVQFPLQETLTLWMSSVEEVEDSTSPEFPGEDDIGPVSVCLIRSLPLKQQLGRHISVSPLV